MRHVLALLALALSVGAVRAQIHFIDFSSPRNLNLIGDARIFGADLRLTPARSNQAGAAWYIEKQLVARGFETTFQFRLTHQDHFWGFRGTDGLAFVAQNSGLRAIGGRGSAAGFGLPDPTNPRHPGIGSMIAVFFDTLRNPQEGDPSSNYIAIRTSGPVGESRWPTPRVAFAPRLNVLLKDRRVHSARIVYEPPILSVFLDGFADPVLRSIVDLSIAADRDGKAWVGFTAATGFGYQNHDILSWSFSQPSVSSSVSLVSSEITFPLSACLPNRHLCTPERPSVRQERNKYHVVLPANQIWAVSIPNPPGYAVEIRNAKGIVCWDATGSPSQACGGPLADGGSAGADFLVPDKPAGALIMSNRQGRTWFAVNGPRGQFENSEGFFEFDLELEKLAK